MKSPFLKAIRSFMAEYKIETISAFCEFCNVTRQDIDRYAKGLSPFSVGDEPVRESAKKLLAMLDVDFSVLFPAYAKDSFETHCVGLEHARNVPCVDHAEIYEEDFESAWLWLVAFRSTTPSEFEIINMRFEGDTLEEIRIKMHYGTIERIRQIEQRALRKIKLRARKKRPLIEYISNTDGEASQFEAQKLLEYSCRLAATGNIAAGYFAEKAKRLLQANVFASNYTLPPSEWYRADILAKANAKREQILKEIKDKAAKTEKGREKENEPLLSGIRQSPKLTIGELKEGKAKEVERSQPKAEQQKAALPQEAIKTVNGVVDPHYQRPLGHPFPSKEPQRDFFSDAGLLYATSAVVYEVMTALLLFFSDIYRCYFATGGYLMIALYAPAIVRFWDVAGLKMMYLAACFVFIALANYLDFAGVAECSYPKLVFFTTLIQSLILLGFHSCIEASTEE